MIKKALCIQGSGGNGKTRTIRLILDNLLHRGAALVDWADTILPVADKNADCCVMLDYCGKRIGIESQGDTYSRQATSLKKFVEQKCDVIVCACREQRQYGLPCTSADQVRLRNHMDKQLGRQTLAPMDSRQSTLC